MPRDARTPVRTFRGYTRNRESVYLSGLSLIVSLIAMAVMIWKW